MSELETGAEEVLRLPSAGPKAIRQSAIRTGGSLAGLALLGLASAFLLRHLGVVDSGRYFTVMAIVSVADSIAGAGLGVVGQREYVQYPVGDKARLLGNILGLRLLIIPLALMLATAFALAAGYTRAMVLGVLIAGAGVLVSSGRRTLTIPQQASLRITVIALADLARDAVVAGGVIALAVAGASLLPFFTVHVAAAVASIVVISAWVGYRGLPRARFDWPEWRPILAQAIPMGLVSVLNVLYLRTLLLVTSKATDAYQTGLFAASNRAIELAVVSGMLLGPAFPILAHAAANDERRLQYVLQRMLEVMSLLAVGLVLFFSIGGTPLLKLFGSGKFTLAGPVFQIQSFALFGSLTAALWANAIIAARRQNALLVTNALALVLVIVLGTTLVPAYGAKGAAAAAIAGESLLSVGGYVILRRLRPNLRFAWGFVLRIGPAAGAGALCLLIPGLSPLPRAVVALAVYAVAAFALRAVPVEVFEAFGLRKPDR